MSALTWRPFSDRDDEIERHLADVSVPVLLLACVHITGDATILDGAYQPHGLMVNEEQGFMAPDEQAAALAFALQIIVDYRERGCPPVKPVAAETIRRMMSWVACEPVDDRYLAMARHEVGLTEHPDATGTGPAPSDLQARADFPVIVIGCGESGLLAAIECKRAGIPVTVIEKNPGLGGTWYENSYPGARVDSPNHLYTYSFEPIDHWSKFFSEQPELKAYFENVAQRHGITDLVRFSTEVQGARWNDDTATWTVTVVSDAGVEELTARAVISAVGQLNRPMVPDLPGSDSFIGPAFHTARWDHDADLAGLHVAMIGAGASGFQVAPAIADQVATLTVFQRTAQWMFPNPNYHASVGAGVTWAIRHLPYYARWYRFLLMWAWCDKGLEPARVDKQWPGQDRSVSELNEGVRLYMTDWITSQVAADAELATKVVPDYPPLGKRMLQDNGSWLATLQRDHVELVREPIRRITPKGIETTDGTAYPADVIVYATGFRASDMLLPMQIVGRGGADLRQRWGQRPVAYLGITIPDFPNFFCMYGPGTNLASSGSIIFHSECQATYIVSAITHLADRRLRSAEPTSAVTEDWANRSQRELATMVWTQPSVKHSFYKNDNGEIYILSPWRVVDYWHWTRRFDPAEYEIR